LSVFDIRENIALTYLALIHTYGNHSPKQYLRVNTWISAQPFLAVSYYHVINCANSL